MTDEWRARGITNGNGRLTFAEVEEIRRLYIPGRGGNAAELAHAYGISRRYVSLLARGLWRKTA